MVCCFFILPEFCKPCLFLFAHLIVPYPGELAELFCKIWGAPARWEYTEERGPHEDAVLKLDCAKIQSVLGWKPKWNTPRAVQETVTWTKAWLAGENMVKVTEDSIKNYLSDKGCGCG